MKKNCIAILTLLCLVISLCACGTKQTTLDVTIDGGANSVDEAITSYYSALSSKDFDALINVSASMNKSCVQNTVGNYDEEKYNSGIESTKEAVAKDLDSVTITVSVGETVTYAPDTAECKAFIKEFKTICVGIDKIQTYAVTPVTLTYSDGSSENTETRDEKCIQIQDKWFVFDYSEDEVNADDSTKADADVTIVGGGSSVEDAISKYYKAISNKDATSLADVLMTLNATAVEAVTGEPDSQHDANVKALETELKADNETVTLTPTLTNSTTYEAGSTEMDTFISSNEFIVRTSQVEAYTTASVSLSITVSGDSDTYSDTATITCVKIGGSWFIIDE